VKDVKWGEGILAVTCDPATRGRGRARFEGWCGKVTREKEPWGKLKEATTRPKKTTQKTPGGGQGAGWGENHTAETPPTGQWGGERGGGNLRTGKDEVLLGEKGPTPSERQEKKKRKVLRET